MTLSRNQTVRNAGWIIGGKIIQSGLGVLISMMTARFLGPSNFGLINYAASIVTFLTPVMQLGFSSILVHEFMTKPEEEGETLGTAIAACFCSGILCVIGVISFAGIVNRGETETVIVCALYSLMILAQAVEMMEYWYQAHLMSKYTSIVSMMAYVLFSAYRIFLLVTQKNIYWFAVSNALDHLLIAGLQVFFFKRLKGPALSVSFQKFRKLFQIGKYYILSGIMIAIFSQTDRIMLKLMIGDAATGMYSAAVASASLTAFVFSAIIQSGNPAIFASKKIGQDAFERNVSRLFSVVIYGALLQSVGVTLFARPVILLLYGSAYDAAIPALRIIVWYTTFCYIGSVRNTWILAEGKQHLIWRIDISGAIANVLLNFALIPLWGINGAALASLITQIFTNVIVVFLIKETRRSIVLMAKSLNPAILCEMVRNLNKK